MRFVLPRAGLSGALGIIPLALIMTIGCFRKVLYQGQVDGEAIKLGGIAIIFWLAMFWGIWSVWRGYPFWIWGENYRFKIPMQGLRTLKISPLHGLNDKSLIVDVYGRLSKEFLPNFNLRRMAKPTRDPEVHFEVVLFDEVGTDLVEIGRGTIRHRLQIWSSSRGDGEPSVNHLVLPIPQTFTKGILQIEVTKVEVDFSRSSSHEKMILPSQDELQRALLVEGKLSVGLKFRHITQLWEPVVSTAQVTT